MRKGGRKTGLSIAILLLTAGAFIPALRYRSERTSFHDAKVEKITAEERTVGDKTAEDKTTEERTAEDKTAEKRAAEERTAEELKKALRDQETLIACQAEGTTAYAFVSKAGRTDYGDLFVVFEREEERKEPEVQEEDHVAWKRVYENDFQELKPWKLELGDVDGDGATDILTSVRKATDYDAAEKNRLFVFEYKDQKLVKKWTGSQIAGVWKDFEVGELLPAKGEEILFISREEDGKEKLGVYSWFDFGFQLLAESGGYDPIAGLIITGENRMELTYDEGREEVVLTVKDGRIIQVEP